MIWKHPKYVEGRKFYELFDSKKILARAHFRARAGRIFYHLSKKSMISEFSQRCEIRRAPHAEMCARQKFFWKCNLHDKISLQIFLFGHNSKSEFFRAIWSLKFFSENSIFSKNFGFGKFWKFSIFFLDFSWKNSIFKGIYSNEFNRYKNFENT